MGCHGPPKHWSKQNGLAAGIVRDVIQAICSATCFVIGFLLEHVMQSFPALHLSTVFRMGAEMVQGYSQEPWANFYSGSGRFGSGACAVHESLSVCSMCRITGSKCQKNMLNTFTIYCKSRAFAGAVASTCWHFRADRKQEHRIKPFDSKVYQSRSKIRYRKQPATKLQHNLLLTDCWWTAACCEVPWKSQAGAFIW